MTYKITNLVQFYLVTMRKTIGQEAGLTATLQQWVYPYLLLLERR